METIHLKDLSVGEEAAIVGYAPSDPGYRNKLLSLGLTKDTKIRLIQMAPLGDPVEIEVRGFRLSLRKDEADVILLKKLDGSPQQGHRHRFRFGFLKRFGK
ncbi:MAG: FeoA family protein [Spirochaetales bacterium]